MQAIENLWSFVTPEFTAAAVAVQGLMALTKSVTKAVAPSLMRRKWYRGVVSAQNVYFGVCIAGIPGFLQGETFGQRCVYGVCAGLVSQSVYETFLKRFKR